MDSILLLAKHPTPAFEESLERFRKALIGRDPLMEYKVLTRINCHKQKYDKLFKTLQGEFKLLNKYADILPFKNNRVLLGKP